MRVRSLSHGGITVKNFKNAVRWWWDIFSFPLVSESYMSAKEVEDKQRLYNLPKGVTLHLGFLRLPKGGVLEIFEFSENQEPNHCWNRPGPHHITIDVTNIKGWYKKLKDSSSVELLCEPTLKEGAWWFFFRDPDGNLIELIDLGINYYAIRLLGGIAGFFMRKTKFKKYYQ